MFFQPLHFFLSKISHGTMFLLTEIRTLHRTALSIEITDIMVCKEILGLYKAEIHGADVIVVEHHYVCVAVKPLPAVGSFMSPSFSVFVGVIKYVRTCNVIGIAVFWGSSMFVADIKEMIGVTHLDYI